MKKFAPFVCLYLSIPLFLLLYTLFIVVVTITYYFFKDRIFYTKLRTRIDRQISLSSVIASEARQSRI